MDALRENFHLYLDFNEEEKNTKQNEINIAKSFLKLFQHYGVYNVE